MCSSVRITQFRIAAFVPAVIYVGSKNMISATSVNIETSHSRTFMASFEQFEGTSLNHDHPN